MDSPDTDPVNPSLSARLYSSLGNPTLLSENRPRSTFRGRSGEVVESLLSGAEISGELSKLIMNRAGGNPLFLEELTYALLESGYIKRGEKGYELSGKVGEIQVPDTIQGIIAARLDRLEENLRRTVQVASVIGRRFALSLLEAVVGAKEEVKAHLLELQNLEFIYETILFPEREYEFKHASYKRWLIIASF